mmetsp:Transcript_127857/g.331496  ORF Transcript_127857/g.331496 Transcript_127857/m.331496 type:complete len:113 (-) Transcript_127857:1133-1471(-)
MLCLAAATTILRGGVVPPFARAALFAIAVGVVPPPLLRAALVAAAVDPTAGMVAPPFAGNNCRFTTTCCCGIVVDGGSGFPATGEQSTERTPPRTFVGELTVQETTFAPGGN